MTNLTFTGGSVTYERNVKVADYENKKLAVTLNFNAPEGETASPEEVSEVADAAIALVHAKLGIAGGLPTKREPVTTAPGQPSAAPAPATPPARPRKPAKPPVVDVVLTDEDKAKLAEKRAITETPEDRKDPAAIDDGDASAAASVEGVADPAAIEDDPFAAADPDITDQDLVDAATKKVEKIKTALPIRQLVGKYGVPNMQSLKQEQRKDFLEKLAAL